MKYKRQENRKVKVGNVMIACCDCGLTHKMGFVMTDDGSVRIDFERNDRATAQIRRGKMPYLKFPNKGDKWKMIRTQESKDGHTADS